MAKTPVETIKYLTPQELKAFFRAIERERRTVLKVRDRCLFSLVLSYGLRIKEASLLRVQNIDWAVGKIFIRRVKRRNYGDNYPLSVDIMRAIRAWLKVRETMPYAAQLEPLFITMNGREIDDQTVYARFRKYARMAGLSKEKQHPHCLRHTTAISLVQADISLLEIKERLGHSSLESTIIYAKLAGKERLEMNTRMNRVLDSVRGR